MLSPIASPELYSGTLTLSPVPSLISGLLLHVRMYIHKWPQWTEALPHSAKPQLLSMTTSYLQNQYHLGDLHITKSGFQQEIELWPP